MSQPRNMLFYSTKCRFSQAFLEELARTPYTKEFRYVCVDAKPGQARPQLPGYVKAVPTLMIDGEPEPRTDSQVMNWLSERRLKERAAVAPSGFSSGLGGGSMGAGPIGEDGPSAYTSEMSGMGDEGFSYIDDDTSASKSANVRLTGNMASVNDIHMMVAPDSRQKTSNMMADTKSGGQQSSKGKALDDAFTRFQKERELDLPGGPQRR